MVGITDSTDISLSKLREIVKGREAWRAVVHGVTKSWTQMSDSTTSVTQELPRWCRGKEPTCHCRR